MITKKDNLLHAYFGTAQVKNISRRGQVRTTRVLHEEGKLKKHLTTSECVLPT
jgi:hypothetical protein